MKQLLYKEMKLTASKLTYIFILCTLMTFIPGYPILMGAFFVCFGIFQTVQFAREDNDILFSVLLPVRKKDIVNGKYMFAVVIQASAFLLTAVFTVLRMTVLSGSAAYEKNVMMSANLVFLGFVLLIYALFNTVFLGGFFRTAYYFGKPFVLFIILTMIVISAGEALHHIPGLGSVNDVKPTAAHAIFLCVCALIYAAATILSCNASRRRFEMIDI